MFNRVVDSVCLEGIHLDKNEVAVGQNLGVEGYLFCLTEG